MDHLQQTCSLLFHHHCSISKRVIFSFTSVTLFHHLYTCLMLRFSHWQSTAFFLSALYTTFETLSWKAWRQSFDFSSLPFYLCLSVRKSQLLFLTNHCHPFTGSANVIPPVGEERQNERWPGVPNKNPKLISIVCMSISTLNWESMTTITPLGMCCERMEKNDEVLFLI